jgi:hypothetical protein
MSLEIEKTQNYFEICCEPTTSCVFCFTEKKIWSSRRAWEFSEEFLRESGSPSGGSKEDEVRGKVCRRYWRLAFCSYALAYLRYEALLWRTTAEMDLSHGSVNRRTPAAPGSGVFSLRDTRGGSVLISG